MEKEALELTWGCECFLVFLIGRHFVMETDLKWGWQALTDFPPKIKWFRLRIMRFRHTPGKALLTADTLMRPCQSKLKFETDRQRLNGRHKRLYPVNEVIITIPYSAKYCTWHNWEDNCRKTMFALRSCHTVRKGGPTAPSSQVQWKF